MRNPRLLLAGLLLPALLAAGPTASPAAASAAPPPPTGRADLTAFRGVGTWLDAYDWSREYGGRHGIEAVDVMARAGVKTLYLQAAKEGPRSPRVLLSTDRMAKILVRAHGHGMRVVAWYLPTFADPRRDWAHLDAVRRFRASGQRFDAIGVDIEWRNGVADVRERNRRLVALTAALRRAEPRLPLAGIVVAPVVTDVINKNFWNPFPWRELAPHYDVWQPMGYWTDRKESSGWRDGYQYTRYNVALLRRDLGRPNAPVHPIGGIGAGEAGDLSGFVRAAREQRTLGVSLYDYPTTPTTAYRVLRTGPA